MRHAAAPGRNLFRSCSSNWCLALLSRDAPFVARVMETFGQWQRALAILAEVTRLRPGIPSESCLEKKYLVRFGYVFPKRNIVEHIVSINCVYKIYDHMHVAFPRIIPANHTTNHTHGFEAMF